MFSAKQITRGYSHSQRELQLDRIVNYIALCVTCVASCNHGARFCCLTSRDGHWSSVLGLRPPEIAGIGPLPTFNTRISRADIYLAIRPCVNGCQIRGSTEKGGRFRGHKRWNLSGGNIGNAIPFFLLIFSFHPRMKIRFFADVEANNFIIFIIVHPGECIWLKNKHETNDETKWWISWSTFRQAGVN